MGRMSLLEYLRNTDVGATVYGIEVYQPKEGLSQQDKWAIQNALKRKQGKYSHVSYLYVESTTSDVKGSEKLKCQGAGRPKTVPIGKKVQEHVHIAVIGTEEQSAYKYAIEMVKFVNKRFGEKRASWKSKGREEHAHCYIHYLLRQADHIRRGGDYDFEQHRCDTYWRGIS